MADGFRIGADFSASLINRTGVHFVAEAIRLGCAELIDESYHWRFKGNPPSHELTRKILGRLMLYDYRFRSKSRHFAANRPGVQNGWKTLFLDPFYVVFSNVTSEDIVLCHDVGPRTHPELYSEGINQSFNHAYKKILSAKPGMVFVSDYTKRNFIEHFGEDFRFLKTISLFPREMDAAGATEPVSQITKPFLLTVGAMDVRKNTLKTVEAFKHSKARNTHQLVLCGPKGDNRDNIENAADLDSISILGRVPDEQLRWLYKNAAGFVLPSLMEGFGMPAIEAAEYELPCLLSRNSAQEEAVGGAAIFVDPTSTENIAMGMDHLVSLSQSERNALVTAAKQHAATYSHERFIKSWRRLLQQEKHGSPT